MADHREYRRRRYFDQLFKQHTDWASEPPWDDATAEGADPEDQVIYKRGRIVTRVDPARRADIDSALNEFEFSPDDDATGLQFGADVVVYSGPFTADVPSIVRQLAPKFGDSSDPLGHRIAPEYVFVAQQTVHPAEDPESTEPLPPVDSGENAPGHGKRIAVIDTGLADEQSRPYAPPEVVYADPTRDVDALLGTRGPLLGPAAGHGSFISDLIHRVAPGVRVINLKVAEPDGACTEEGIVNAIRRSLESEPDIVNLSLGMYAFRISPSRRSLLAAAGEEPDELAVADIWRSERWTVPPIMLQAAIEGLLQRDIVVVASAGNSNSIDPMYPAAYRGVVGVAAVDREGRRCSFSDYGDWVTASARGNHLKAMYVFGDEDPYYESDGRPDTFDGWADWAGTSFSAPLVAAEIALEMAQSSLNGPAAIAAVLNRAQDAPDWGCGKWVRPNLPGQVT